MYCICCKEYKLDPYLDTDLWKTRETKSGKTLNINNEMISGGIINTISAGYGSEHYGSIVIIAICDDCITKCLEDATLLYCGDYMNGSQTFVDEKIEKSKKIYRRRSNLDKLI